MISGVPNPFTKALAATLRQRKLKSFIAHWDAIEALVIRVYRGKAATADDDTEFAALKQQATEVYPALRESLEPHWRQAKVGGVPATQDPFESLLSRPTAAAFLGDWAAMQALPAAREALNRLVLEVQP
jgi:hypothetical protein